VSAAAGTAAWVAAVTIGWDGTLRALAATLAGLVLGAAVLAVGLSIARVEEWAELVAGFRPAARRGAVGGADVRR